MSGSATDRYVSFAGIDCDEKARQVLNHIQQYVDIPPHASPWVDYFRAKLGDRLSLGQDELHFVGSQLNNIRALFEEYADGAALDLLDQVEEECC